MGCQKLEATTLSSPQVVDLAKSFVSARVERGRDDAAIATLKPFVIPDVRIYASNGDVLFQKAGVIEEAALVEAMKGAIAKK
ncbi:MAG: hypothetical protein HYZ53_29845 [Planctomycetes bacterium]|nr:hypothetical protein [Planctomycetota bacterium]